MIDFLMISRRTTKNGVVEIYPKFIIKKSEDLMIRGGDFYAIWMEERKLWSTDEQDALQLIDRELDAFAKETASHYESGFRVLHMWDAESGMIDRWHKYCQKQMRDSFHMLDEKLIFSNTETTKQDYASKKLNYPLQQEETPGYNRLMEVLYSPEERQKIEWAIGSIVSGESKRLQKFVVLYGAAGTGKSTVLNVVQQLFEGYYSVFDAKALGSSSNAFALEAFKGNPLVGIQHDGDLSRIEDNTRLNSLVSHEMMTVNEKFKSTYANQFKCFLFMGTNKPVRITDAKSGLIRRLIDVSPTGNRLSQKEYMEATHRIAFELGGIAWHCLQVYRDDPDLYESYIPTKMLDASNDFYNFVFDSYLVFKDEDTVSLKAAWDMYKAYCEEARVQYPYSQRIFKEELKNYFRDYSERSVLEDGSRVRSIYSGFRADKFEQSFKSKPKDDPKPKSWLIFDKTKSLLDVEYADCPAQYAKDDGTPAFKWDNVKTRLKDLDTSKEHFVLPPGAHIVADFDIPDENGEKSLERNLAEASKWPKTYAELSRSGQGIHLHYIYTGDPGELSRLFADHIEIKVFTGKSSLRRKLTKCNDIPIATISSGLPVRKEKKVVDFDAVKSEKSLRALIKRNLNKEIHADTRSSVDFIYKILEDAYDSGLHYDVSDMFNDILVFAGNSTHQSQYCLDLVSKMKMKSEEPSESSDNSEAPIAFYDVEVFPNLFLVNWKFQGKDKPCYRMINPTPKQIEDILKYRLVGFNCRRYDNHILYARYALNYSNEELYHLSQRIIAGDREAFFGEAYNLSYTDVYDFCTTKQSLKKWEIELGIHHKELGLPWDKPVPENMWKQVAEYCDNDVIATEAVFDARQEDFMARQIQVELVKALHGISNVCVNDTTNSLSEKIIFGSNKKPQSQFNYRNLAEPVTWKQYHTYRQKFGKDYIFHIFTSDGTPCFDPNFVPLVYNGPEKDGPLPDGYSILPFFPGYIYKNGKSTYMGEEIGEGGKVYAEPGMYEDVWDADIASQHPHSAIAEVLFGPKYTKIFEELVEARVAIKHKDFEKAGGYLKGVLKPWLDDKNAKGLAQALKIVINAIYGETAAHFENRFRDKRNVDNIVAKRGALFMTLLKSEVQKCGYTVCHIKTDSIKILHADDKIRKLVTAYGKAFGYDFETEAEFDRFCLVNDAVYISKEKGGDWSATGKQFQVPYVFKTIFSHEKITFEDLCEMRSANTALYLDMNESLPDVTREEKELDKLRKKYPDGIPNDILEPLEEAISKGHNYQFIGKVGEFCPIRTGEGGGRLLMRKDNKFNSVSGAKDYRWLESETVKEKHLETSIDITYYTRLVDDALETIGKYGDIEWLLGKKNDISDFPPDDECPF